MTQYVTARDEVPIDDSHASLLFDLIVSHKPGRILELGIGKSTEYILKGLVADVGHRGKNYMNGIWATYTNDKAIQRAKDRDWAKGANLAAIMFRKALNACEVGSQSVLWDHIRTP